MKTKRFFLAAILGFASTLALSCSGDSGSSDPNANSGKETSSSSKGTGKSSSSSSEISLLEKGKIIGVSQKGPFAKGSAITLSELNDKFSQTGRSFEATITDDKGSFEIGIKDVELVSPYVMLKVNGYYRNEVTGKISAAPINLYAITDIREKSNVNVNILTHLEYNRIQKLVEGGKSLKDAKKQAQREILAVFSISGEFKDSEDMSIFGTSDGDAALLAISVLLQGDLSEGQFTERLADFSLEFKETGAWDNKAEKDKMADWAVRRGPPGSGLNYCEYDPTQEYQINCWPMPTKDTCKNGRLVAYCSNPNITDSLAIRSNILGWNLSSSVPDFEKFVNNYWYVNYGLGDCNANSKGSIKKSNRNVDYICKDNAWVMATEYERDTYKCAACTKEGETKDGQASGKKYICKDKSWVLATAAESDLGLCTTEGEVKSGYICKSKDWVPATQYELDVGGLGNCSVAGEIKKGNVSDTKYTCKDKAWVEARYIEAKCFESKSCQTFTDARDKQSYYSVKIGTQTWMAENLNYAADNSKCYDNKPANCVTYGRLYDWATAMKACPSGWHLPSDAEWNVLMKFLNPSCSDSNNRDYCEGAGIKLKTTSGWNSYYSNYLGTLNGNGTDDYGFSALPGGDGYSDGSFHNVGNFGSWWSSSENNINGTYSKGMDYSSDGVLWDYSYDGKYDFFSVRCVKD